MVLATLELKVEDEVDLVVLRNNELINLSFTLGVIDGEDILGGAIKVRQIGIYASNDPNDRVRKEYGVFSALWQATISTKDMTVNSLQRFKCKEGHFPFQKHSLFID